MTGHGDLQERGGDRTSMSPEKQIPQGASVIDSAYLLADRTEVQIRHAGDDLTIHLYGGPSASANVLDSTDGISFSQIGTIGGDRSSSSRS